MSVFDDLATKFKGLNTDLSERLKFDPPEADLPFTDYVKKARPQQAGVTSNALPPALTGAAPSPPPLPPAASPTPQPFGAKVAPYTPKVDEAKKKAQAWVSDYMKSKGFSADDVVQSLAGGNPQRGIGPWESYGQQASKEGWTPEKGATEAEKQARIFSTPGIQEKVPVVNKALQTAARKVGQGVGGVASLKGVPYAPRVGEVVGEVGAGMFEPRTADELANEPAWAQMLNAAPMGVGDQALVDDAIRAIFQPRLTATALAQGPKAYARTALETTGPAIGFPKQELRTAAAVRLPNDYTRSARITKFHDATLQTSYDQLKQRVEAVGIDIDALAGNTPQDYIIAIERPAKPQWATANRTMRNIRSAPTMPERPKPSGISEAVLDWAEGTKGPETSYLQGQPHGVATTLFFPDVESASRYLATGEYKPFQRSAKVSLAGTPLYKTLKVAPGPTPIKPLSTLSDQSQYRAAWGETPPSPPAPSVAPAAKAPAKPPTGAAPPVTSAMPSPAPPKAGLTPEQQAERAAAPWRKGPFPQGPPQPRPAPDVTVPPVEAPKAAQGAGQAVVPPVEPPKPPTVAPPTLMPEPQSIRGAVDEVLKALKEGKKLQPLTRAMQHEERVRRVKSAMSVLQNQGLSADEAFKQAKMAYAGKMERPGLTPPNIAPETQNLLRETIRSTPAIPETYTYTRTTADDALMKVFRGELPTKGEIELLGELFGPAFEQSLRDMLPTKDKIIEAALDLLNLPRTVKASFDLSAPLRQGMWLFPRHVQRALPDMVAMVRAFGSEKFARNLDNLYRGNLELGIAPDPSWVKSQEHGLYYAPLQRGAGTLTKREEAFMSRLAEKIPGVRMSERAYVTYLNKFRQDVWKYYSDQLAKAGAEGWEYDELAKFLNYATGRGDLKMFAQAAPQLSAIFFSPRMQAATIEMPLMMANKSKAVRRIATENIAATLGTGVSLLGLAALAGASVELDPRSSDFAKIRVGNTRIDVWAGKQQYNVLLARLISGRGKSSVTGNLYEIGGNSFAGDKLSLVGQFTRGKLAPGPALGTDVFVGQDFLGRPMEWNRAGGIARSTLVPMSVDTMVEAAQQDGALGALFATPGVLGVGVSSYGSKVADMNERWRKDLQEYRDLPSNANEAKAKGTLTRDKYRERHPDIEAKLFLLGEVESLQSIGARVQALKFMKELGVGMADVRGLQPKPYESTDRAALRRWFQAQLGVQPTSSPSQAAPNREPVPAGAPSQPSNPPIPTYEEWKRQQAGAR